MEQGECSSENERAGKSECSNTKSDCLLQATDIEMVKTEKSRSAGKFSIDPDNSDQTPMRDSISVGYVNPDLCEEIRVGINSFTAN